jgi:hypothetical protein
LPGVLGLAGSLDLSPPLELRRPLVRAIARDLPRPWILPGLRAGVPAALGRGGHLR